MFQSVYTEWPKRNWSKCFWTQKWSIRQLILCIWNLPPMSNDKYKESIETKYRWRHIHCFEESHISRLEPCSSFGAHFWHLHSIRSFVEMIYTYRLRLIFFFKRSTQNIYTCMKKRGFLFFSWQLSFLCNFYVCAEYYFHIIFERMRFIHIFVQTTEHFATKLRFMTWHLLYATANHWIYCRFFFLYWLIHTLSSQPFWS